jgi:hypothetical protein
MTFYNFMIRDGRTTDTGGDPVELPNLQTAQGEAVKLAGAMIRDYGAGFWAYPEFELAVSDEMGTPLFSLSFRGSSAPASQ